MSENLKLLQNNWVIIFMAVMGLIGCISFMLCGIGIDVLGKQARNISASKNPFVKQMKLRYENGEKVGGRKQSSYGYVIKYMEKYTFFNCPIRNYIRLAWLCMLSCMMVGLVGGIITANSWYVAYACVCAVAILCVGKIEDIDHKEMYVIYCFTEYFDNFLTFDKKTVESSADDDYNTIRKVDEPHDKNDDTAQRQLIDEVIREFLT